MQLNKHTRKIEYRVCMLNRRILMPANTILFLGYLLPVRTIIGQTAYVHWMMLFQGASMLSLFILGIAADSRARIDWLKHNAFAVLYLCTRFITLILTGFDITVLRSIWLETFYLLAVTDILTGGFSGNKVQKNILCVSSILINAANLVIYLGYSRFPEELQRALRANTIVEKYPFAAICTNPNAGGIFGATVLIISLIWFARSKGIIQKTAAGLFAAFHLICFLVLYRSVRSADVALAATGILFLAGLIFRQLRGRAAVLVTLVCMLLGIAALGWFYTRPENSRLRTLNDQEFQLMELSTGRTIIWKTCFASLNETSVLGRGSLRLDRQYRKEYIDTHAEDAHDLYYNSAGYEPHNGYLAMISVTGWVGFSLCMIHMILQFLRAKHLDHSWWYLVPVYVLVNNFFEGWFILDHFIPCLYLFMILRDTAPDFQNPEGLNRQRRGKRKTQQDE